MIKRWSTILLLLAFVSQASDGYKDLYENEKGKYWIYFDYEGSMSDICHFVISTKENIYSCFTSGKLENIRCDTTKREDKNIAIFDSVQSEVSKTISQSKLKDDMIRGICRINGFGYITSRSSISCKYTTIACDTCKYEKHYPSNSCKDSKKKSLVINNIQKIIERME